MLALLSRPGLSSSLATHSVNTKLTIAAIADTILAVTSPIMIVVVAPCPSHQAAHSVLLSHYQHFRQHINDDEDAHTSAQPDVLGDFRDGLRENNLRMVEWTTLALRRCFARSSDAETVLKCGSFANDGLEDGWKQETRGMKGAKIGSKAELGRTSAQDITMELSQAQEEARRRDRKSVV